MSTEEWKKINYSTIVTALAWNASIIKSVLAIRTHTYMLFILRNFHGISVFTFFPLETRFWHVILCVHLKSYSYFCVVCITVILSLFLISVLLCLNFFSTCCVCVCKMCCLCRVFWHFILYRVNLCLFTDWFIIRALYVLYKLISEQIRTNTKHGTMFKTQDRKYKTKAQRRTKLNCWTLTLICFAKVKLQKTQKIVVTTYYTKARRWWWDTQHIARYFVRNMYVRKIGVVLPKFIVL